jgi:hypothetical protein
MAVNPMAFDADTRNKLARMAADARAVLGEEFTAQLQEVYGIQPDGKITPVSDMRHLDDEQRDAAAVMRERIGHLKAGMKGERNPDRAAVDRMTREQSFTVLNRFAALRMCEERGLIPQCVGGGMDSKGFQVFLRVAGTGLGDQYERYRTFLFSVFDEISVDLGILFDRFSSMGLLFPRERALHEIFAILNRKALTPVWTEDETLGWMYQYFNSADERRDMRRASAAPRNSRELAVRNQFFTPRYVVEFLTDNTLGRTWYEMRRGETRLAEECRYLVRRPDEVFLDYALEDEPENPGLRMLLEGTEETWPEFDASDEGIFRIIQLAHAVNGYARHPMGEGDEIWWPWRRKAEILEAGGLDEVSTQDMLDILFAQVRADRFGTGDGGAFRSEPILVEMANEVRRRALASRAEDLSREEMLRAPVFVPPRLLKDPRTIRMLDPACGSMHFGLYAFDLYERIYQEAWEIEGSEETVVWERPVGMKPLGEAYETREALLRDVPRLILAHNIHGIDIDARAVQIASLSLWLRAQRSWKEQGIPPAERPRILKSNVVTAEPMPGDEELRRRFLRGLREPALASLVESVFEKMELAGEAGSLLKIEEEIKDVVAEAREAARRGPEREQSSLFPEPGRKRPKQQSLEWEMRNAPSGDFWKGAEARILAALKDYAALAENGESIRLRLFAEDTERGFSFIDISKKRYDVVLMNPPFGDASLPSKGYLEENYGDTKGDVYKAFVECFHDRLVPSGHLGIISSRTGFFLGQSEDWRTRVVLRLYRPLVLADLGSGVLDAMVEVAAYVLRSLSETEKRDLTLSLVPVLIEAELDRQKRLSVVGWRSLRDGLKRHQAISELMSLEGAGFIRRIPGKVDRFTLKPNISDFSKFQYRQNNSLITCIRATGDSKKEKSVRNSLIYRPEGKFFICNSGSFSLVPGTPFCYWITDSAKKLFIRFPPLQAAHTVASGTGTLDDFRFLRFWFEVPSGLRQKDWFPYAKGGHFSKFYFDQYLYVNWGKNGKEMKSWIIHKYKGGHWARNIRSTELYFRPGLTWPRRTNGLSFRIMPRGCIFADKGPAIFSEDDNTVELLSTNSVLSSIPFVCLVSLQIARVQLAQSFEVGIVQKTPFPNISSRSQNSLANNSLKIWNKKRELDRFFMLSHAFETHPAFIFPEYFLNSLVYSFEFWSSKIVQIECDIHELEDEINKIAFQLYGVKAEDESHFFDCASGINLQVASISDDKKKISGHVSEILCYMVGSCFGRWDLRLAQNPALRPDPPDPFAPLPVCPPGMLQNPDGLPATPNHIVSEEWLRARPDAATLPPAGSVQHPTIPDADYPLRASWKGILVNDARDDAPPHPEDVVVRIREVLDLLWKEKAHDIEQEAVEILKVNTLRDHFTKPAGFFADHLKRYSKSRRKAPIYWPLSTESNRYTLWIYYPRLTDQTLYACVTDFVDPKIQEVSRDIARAHAELEAGGGAKARAQLESLNDFHQELADFKAELLRVAKLPYRPNLNDGVLLTAAPLWRLFRHKPWQKELKSGWEKLKAGEYDWAHIAHSIWPDRVRDKCRTDRSLAIAHELESICEVKAPAKKTRKTRKKT